MRSVTLEDKKPTILKAIELAKTKGATAVKVELEARLNRFDIETDYCSYCNEGQIRCSECSDGYNRCPQECDDGMVRNEEDTEWIDCPEDCDEGYFGCDDCSNGWITCDECHGEWRAAPVWDDDKCLTFLLERLGIDWSIERGRVYNFDEERSDWLQFAKFYNDGSVDSELTFTIRLDKPDNVFKVLEVVDAFKALAAEIDQGFDVQGAGMHLAWLFTEDYTYPSYQPVADYDALNNFRRAIDVMMPALYFLAAPANGQNWTRGMRFRNPGVSIGGQKYSAIYIDNGAMEFRVFDTCYDTPEQILDNIVVMGNCMKYLTSTYTGPKVSTDMYSFGNDTGRTLDRLYYQENTLDMLYQYTDKLRPAYYTMKMLRDQRGFKLTKREVKKRHLEIRRNAELAWKEYLDRWNITFDMRINELKYGMMRRYVEEASAEKLEGLTQPQIEQEIADMLKRDEEYIRSTMETEDRFLSRHIKNQTHDLSGQFTISLS